MSNKELAEELHKPITRIFKIDNIWGTDTQLISKFHKGIRFLLRVIDIFNKYVWVITLEDKKGITITNAFQIVLDESNRKPNKVLIDNGSDFYNRSTESWLEKNDI